MFVFQSTPPVKAATNNMVYIFISIIISIHAAREGGDAVTITVCSSCFISIHAAREGGDRMFQRRFPACKNISIHAAREGGDLKIY